MNLLRTCAAGFLTLVLALQAAGDGNKRAIAKLIGPDGSDMGNASFEQTPHGVLIHVKVSGLTPGAHGMHLHQIGACSPDFSAAKGHINPEGKAHGLRNPDGPDRGNLPQIYAHSDGTAEAEFFTTLVSVDDASEHALLDEDGSTLVIHENPDDHFTQPIGGSGGRVSCGVIVATEE